MATYLCIATTVSVLLYHCHSCVAAAALLCTCMLFYGCITIIGNMHSSLTRCGSTQCHVSQQQTVPTRMQPAVQHHSPFAQVLVYGTAAACSYPASVGRNMDEIVRVVDALLLSAEKSVATPANWPNNHADQVGFRWCHACLYVCMYQKKS